jgi:hypothetical protein
MNTTPTPDLSTVPSPESLRPLLEAALAIMEPNDPAKESVAVSINANSENRLTYVVSFYCYGEDERKVFASSVTRYGVIDEFKAKYVPPVTRESLIAFHRSELAKLEAIK